MSFTNDSELSSCLTLVWGRCLSLFKVIIYFSLPLLETILDFQFCWRDKQKLMIESNFKSEDELGYEQTLFQSMKTKIKFIPILLLSFSMGKNDRISNHKIMNNNSGIQSCQEGGQIHLKDADTSVSCGWKNVHEGCVFFLFFQDFGIVCVRACVRLCVCVCLCDGKRADSYKLSYGLAGIKFRSSVWRQFPLYTAPSRQPVNEFSRGCCTSVFSEPWR